MLAVGLEAIPVEQRELDKMLAVGLCVDVIAAEQLEHERVAAIEFDGTEWLELVAS